MEVVFGTQDYRLILWNALDLVTPLARNLDARLDCLSASIHGQDHVVAKELGDEFGEPGEYIIVEGPRA